MAYETALQWGLDHVPPQNFDSFNAWYRELDKKFNTPNLLSNPTFNRMLEEAWISETGTSTEGGVIEQRIPSREREIQMPNKPLIFTVPQRELEKKQEVVVLPQTGRAPTIPRPILIFPKEQKPSITQRFLNLFRIFRRKKK